MESMDSMSAAESMEFHGVHVMLWNPWNSRDSMEFHGIPWIAWNSIESI